MIFHPNLLDAPPRRLVSLVASLLACAAELLFLMALVVLHDALEALEALRR